LIEIATGVNIWRGAQLQAEATFDWKFTGWRSAAISFSFDFRAKLGLGFKLGKEIKPPNLVIPFCATIFGNELGFGRFKLQYGLNGCLSIGLEDMVFRMPKEIVYYREWRISARKQGRITSSTVDLPESITNVWPTEIVNMNLTEIFETIKNTKFEFVISVKVYLEAGLQIGPLLNYTLQIGVGVNLIFNFQGNEQHCLCPYLYGTVDVKVFGFLDMPELVIFHIQIWKDKSQNVEVYTRTLVPTGCIFSAKTTEEGDLQFVDKKVVQLYLLKDFRVEYPFNKNFFKHEGSIIPRFQIMHAGRIDRDLPLPSLVFDCSRCERVVYSLSSIMLVSFDKHTQLRVYASGKNWPETIAKAGFGKNEMKQVELSNPNKNGYWQVKVSYFCNEMYAVDLFKEFPGNGVRWIGFKSTGLPANVEISLLVHGIRNEAYHLENKAIIRDEGRSYDDIRTGCYVTKDEVRVIIERFNPKSNTEVSLAFYRNGHSLQYLIKFLLIANHPLTASQLGVGDFTFDLSGKFPLKISLSLKGKGDKAYHTYNLEISNSELIRVEERSYDLNGKDYSLSLSITRIRPTVSFELPQALTRNERGIFCRVIRIRGSGEERLEFPAGEIYGILRLTDISIKWNGAELYALISLPGLIPLIGSRQINQGLWLIPLKSELFDGSHLIISFRRDDKGKYQNKIELRKIFSSTADALCLEGLKNVRVSGDFVGCLDPVIKGNTAFRDWFALVPVSKGQSLPKPELLKISAQTIDLLTHRLYLFRTTRTTTLDIFPSFFTISASTPYIDLEQSAIQPFLDRNIPISIGAFQATGVEVICDDRHRTLHTSEANPGVFSAVITCSRGARIYATTNNSTKALRLFEISVSETTLFTYGSPDGVIQVRGTGQQPFSTGVKRQIIFDLDGGAAYKSWEGPLNTKIIKNPGQVTVRYSKIGTNQKEELWKLEGFLATGDGEIAIPFGISRYTQNPDIFFESLGLKAPRDGFSGSYVNFTDDGTVIAIQSVIDSARIKNGGVKLSGALDLPASWVKSFVFKGLSASDESLIEEGKQVEEASDGLNKASVLILKVSLSTFGGSLIIALVGLLVYRRRSAGKVKSSSTVSHASLSDDERQEEFTEFVE
jgi:hypothetical protein